MTWFKIDDGFHSHRKRRAATLEAIGLWTVCGSWSAGNLEEGFIPEQQVRFFAGTRYKRLTDNLQAAGLLTPTTKGTETGWQMHDFLEYNPTADSVLADRRAAAERQRRAREKAKASRRDTAVSHTVSHAVTSPVSHGPPDPTRPVSTTGSRSPAAAKTRANSGSDPSTPPTTPTPVDVALDTTGPWTKSAATALRPHLDEGLHLGATVAQLIAALVELKRRGGMPGLLPHLIQDELNRGDDEGGDPHAEWAR